eukprot:CAMPEP_0183508424 /NCGR_PEP_ID=MMETSP0371-20130417/8847_1 /TAXON_ID=268820 /ORGANISM="Peridinium aciculiferum, Strain PAER-2" /LENGTH=39 /DNA_ID= /DNA_START= /DNA_END= /DNA_ORIENTATION=
MIKKDTHQSELASCKRGIEVPTHGGGRAKHVQKPSTGQN